MKWAWALFAALIVLGAIFGSNPHPHFWWDRIPAFGAVLGFGGTWLLVLVAKGVLAPLLLRPYRQGEE